MLTSPRMTIVGRVAAIDNAVIAFLMGLNLVFEGSSHFSSHVWDGPKALFHTVRPYGITFLILSVALIITSRNLNRPHYKWVLYILAVLYGVLAISFAPAGLHPDSSFLSSIMCILGVLSVFHTLLALDPRSRSTP